MAAESGRYVRMGNNVRVWQPDPPPPANWPPRRAGVIFVAEGYDEGRHVKVERIVRHAIYRRNNQSEGNRYIINDYL